jgi:hypothetical protein
MLFLPIYEFNEFNAIFLYGIMRKKPYQIFCFSSFRYWINYELCVSMTRAFANLFYEKEKEPHNVTVLLYEIKFVLSGSR